MPKMQTKPERIEPLQRMQHIDLSAVRRSFAVQQEGVNAGGYFTCPSVPNRFGRIRGVANGIPIGSRVSAVQKTQV